MSVAEINAAGHPVTVRVRMHGADPGALPQQAVWVRTVAAREDLQVAASPVPPVRAVWDGATAEYVAYVEGLLEGMWTVTSARAVPAVGDVASAVEFTVVDVGDIEW